MKKDYFNHHSFSVGRRLHRSFSVGGLIVLITAVMFNFSCKKENDDTITKTFNVSLSMGQTYTARVAQTGDDDDVLQITQQASHASSSELASISGSRDMTFNYTPASQYVGTDQVKITSTEGEHHGGHGHCSGHHHDESTVYVYNITITGNNH
jgi:hypothetical protein